MSEGFQAVPLREIAVERCFAIPLALLGQRAHPHKVRRTGLPILHRRRAIAATNTVS